MTKTKAERRYHRAIAAYDATMDCAKIAEAKLEQAETDLRIGGFETPTSELCTWLVAIGAAICIIEGILLWSRL